MAYVGSVVEIKRSDGMVRYVVRAREIGHYVDSGCHFDSRGKWYSWPLEYEKYVLIKSRKQADRLARQYLEWLKAPSWNRNVRVTDLGRPEEK